MFKSLVPPPPFYSAPDDEKQAFFIYWMRGSISEFRLNDDLIRHFFKEGNIYGLINMSFGEFRSFVFKNLGSSQRDRGRWRNTHWFDKHKVDFRQPLSFVRQSHHQKKVLTETDQHNKDWREFKMFSKDKAKCPRYWRRWRMNNKKDIKFDPSDWD